MGKHRGSSAEFQQKLAQGWEERQKKARTKEKRNQEMRKTREEQRKRELQQELSS